MGVKISKLQDQVHNSYWIASKGISNPEHGIYNIADFKTFTVDVEKLKNIQEFIGYSVTTNRFNQAVENIFGNEPLDVKKLGDFIKWFINDIYVRRVRYNG